MLRRIVSGGQTGADRGALDAAVSLGIATGGWVPKGRRAEDGVIPCGYPNLRETGSAEPTERTELNVRDSDATLLITHGLPTGGSALTLEVAMRLGKPLLHLDLGRQSAVAAAERLRQWLLDVEPEILNVAGPRHSEDRSIHELTVRVLLGALRPTRPPRGCAS